MSYKALQRNQTSFTEELAYAKYYIKDKLAEAFPLMQSRLNSPNLTYYPDVYYLCDQLTSEEYEGVPKRVNLTKQEWDIV